MPQDPRAMDRDRIEKDHLMALFHFAWSLSGNETDAVELAQMVLADTSWHAQVKNGKHAVDVALFTLAFQLFTRGQHLAIPPEHDRRSMLTSLSFRYARDLSTTSLFKSFRKLELPQRAALVLFYTTNCSIHDIATVLHRPHQEAISVISRGKAEWLHILERTAPGQNLPQRNSPGN